MCGPPQVYWTQFYKPRCVVYFLAENFYWKCIFTKKNTVFSLHLENSLPIVRVQSETWSLGHLNGSYMQTWALSAVNKPPYCACVLWGLHLPFAPSAMVQKFTGAKESPLVHKMPHKQQTNIRTSSQTQGRSRHIVTFWRKEFCRNGLVG